jgi:small subunit ribosomal protein S17
MPETTENTEATPLAAATGHHGGRKRRLYGRVVNDTAAAGRSKKTVVVEVVRRYRDPVYGKYIKSRKRYHAHDEKEEYRTNDLIWIEESRPLSATKRWVAVLLHKRPEEV